MKKRRMLICITGMPGAGKSTVANVARKLGIPVVSMGDVIREEAAKRGIECTSQRLGKFMMEIRRREGAGIVAEKCLDKISEIKNRIVVVEGVRSLEEIKVFEENCGEIIILAVHASQKTRFARLKRRGRSDDPSDWEMFKERDLRELEVGIGNVIALSDYILINENTIENIKNKARKLLEHLANVEDKG
ncbi:MAG: flagellar hook-basal body complex protein FliE [Candidatus Verstraetearchaeota archaeon]|nr:flagellar hook-basal body complex protein FliE [Candidatus Verstraetearchaeota archaeon]